jgi:GT2 family glycosyltransferase
MPISSERKIDVSIVIVSYNTRDWLGRCLSSVDAAAVQNNVEIILVDNASRDGSADYVAQEFPQVRVFRNAENAGFARAVNQGARHASGEYLLLLNPDGLLKPGAIDKLVAFTRANPQYVICGGRTVTPDGDMDPKSCWGAPTLWSVFCNSSMLSTLFPGSRLFDPEALGSFKRDHARPVDIVTGCLLMASLADWQSLGGFDEAYFVYGEDADLCMRATAKTGRACAITPEAEMVHAVGASSASRPDKLELLLKGRIGLVRRHMRGWKKTFGTALIVWGVWLRALMERAGAKQNSNWTEVWRRRERWREGYAPLETLVSKPAQQAHGLR